MVSFVGPAVRDPGRGLLRIAVSSGTADISHNSQQGSNDNGKTADPRATARRRR